MYIFKEINNCLKKVQSHSDIVSPQHLNRQITLLKEIRDYIKTGDWCNYDGVKRNPKERFLYCLMQVERDKKELSALYSGTELEARALARTIESCAERYNTSVSAVRSVLSRMSQKILDRIGIDTLTLLSGKDESDLLQAEYQFYAGTGQLSKIVNVGLLTESEEYGAVQRYTLRDCLPELLYLHKHCSATLKRERSELSKEKLAFLCKVLSEPCMKCDAERQAILHSFFLNDAREVKDYIEGDVL